MKYPTVWERDGALRDIYVFEASLGEWQRVLDFVRGAYRFAFRVDDIETPLPASIQAVFAGRSEHSYLLAVEAGNVNIHAHFFLENQVEFDIDPREIESETEEGAVVEFMKGLSADLGRQVVLTMEGAPDWVYLSVDPGQEDPTYTPVEVVRGPEMSRDEGLNWSAEQLGLDKADHEVVIQRLIDAANKPHTAHRPPDPEE